MQVLTPSGYVDVSTLQPGDLVSAFDIDTGAPITNSIENIEFVDLSEWHRWWKPMVDSGELADYPDFTFYKINNTWILNSEQSIWRNGTNVCHVRDLVIGDTVYDDADSPVVIASIELLATDGWYRFDISGDHSYIVDGLTVHNASRFWVSGTGTWDSSTTTHWGSATGVANNSSVPGSADTATFDGSSGGGTVTLNFGGTITVQSITNGAFTGTWDNSPNNNNCTLSAVNGYNGSGTGTRTINLGTATYTLTNTGAGNTLVTFGATTGLTLSAASAIWDVTGNASAGLAQVFTLATTGFNLGTIKISTARLSASGLQLTNTGTISINVAAACYLSVTGAGSTIATLTVSDQLTLTALSGSTLNLTNAPTLSGTAAKPIAILNGTTADSASAATIACSSGTFSGTYVACAGITFSGTSLPTFTNSFDLGRNSGATITAPSAGGPVAQFISYQRGTPY